MNDLEHQIEQYLLDAAGDGWIKSKVLCDRFGLPDARVLRSVGGQPGLCSAFAISLSSKGYKHVSRATRAEYRHFRHGMRRHAISELRRVRNLDRRRHQVITTTKRPEFIRERDTNQGLLFSVPVVRDF